MSPPTLLRGSATLGQALDLCVLSFLISKRGEKEPGPTVRHGAHRQPVLPRGLLKPGAATALYAPELTQPSRQAEHWDYTQFEGEETKGQRFILFPKIWREALTYTSPHIQQAGKQIPSESYRRFWEKGGGKVSWQWWAVTEGP